MKKISVIIPVYNGEKFLHRSLGSLVNQEDVNLNDVEIIAINDGSTDSSLELLLEYQARYPQTFNIVDQHNKGAAATRNLGIDMAKGEFLMLIDQDDSVDCDYLATFYESICNTGHDVIQGNFKTVSSKEELTIHKKSVRSIFERFLAIPAWAKIYRTSFIRDNDIYFFENNIGEDNVFSTKVIVGTNKYDVIEYAGYNNFSENEDSVTNSLHIGLSPKVKILNLLNELDNIKSIDSKTQKMLDYNIFRTGVYYLLSYGRRADANRFMEVYNEIFAWNDTHVRKVYTNFGIGYIPNGDILSAKAGVVTIILLHKLKLISVFSKIYCKG